jgi:hypothetical protein
MIAMKRFLTRALCVLAVAGCDRKHSQAPNTMTTEQLIRLNANTPVGESIGSVASSLATRAILVATDTAPASQPQDVVLSKLRFRTANDNLGRTWAYAYTNMDDFLRTFGPGTPYVELKFTDFFKIIDGEHKFAGIVLNSGPDAMYLIPREVFARVKDAIR